MFVILFALSVLGDNWCPTIENQTLPNDPIYVLNYEFVDAKCTKEACKLPKILSTYVGGDKINYLTVLDENNKPMTCCDFEGRREDIETYVPNMVKHNMFYQSQLGMYWSSFTECNNAEKAYVQYGSCFPPQFNSPYGYFNLTLLTFQDYNVWSIIRNYYTEYFNGVYSVEKLNNLLNTRGYTHNVQWICGTSDDIVLKSVNVCFKMVDNKMSQVECPAVEGMCGAYVSFSYGASVKPDDASCPY
ncbi:hypothetical protein EIN_152970 [Entamoeba invadens IP1]|uniref:Uncharacterized protein n=1 Tax=Entamoeba invadens IP1 TaxID=370355 RepID=A0A0A1U8P9_ENTIV|nr:hypothetical protein EIN_152970 [Entamoeba invadens IP1]ELP91300.1 hypothetical protein EIN_152970 [Entamoeba invadens IP1]|eukprot:XP_004258071.1 hypothetical protein EIN_152970 [Entamoeba invadens IP1]